MAPLIDLVLQKCRHVDKGNLTNNVDLDFHKKTLYLY